MESRWFVWPGQRLEDTNISDRQRALHITSKAWENIKGHLDKKRLAEEALAMERAKKIAMNEESKAMVEKWPNSIMNLFRLQKEERLKDIEAKQEEKLQKFFELKKEQEIVRQKYVDEMMQKIFRKSGCPREIDVAFGTSEVIYERQKQLEVKKFLEQREKQVEAEYAEHVRKGVADEKRENEEKARKQREKNEEYARLCLKQVKEQKEREARKKKASIEAEVIDNINAAKELKALKESRKQELEEYRNMAKKRLQNYRSILNSRKFIDDQEDRDRDEIVLAQAAARDRIDCLVKKKKKELQDIFVARTEAISGIVAAVNQGKAEDEEKILDRVEKEKFEEYDRKEEEKIKHAQKLREERIAEHARIVQQREKKEAERIEVKKWEMANRYKNTDYNKEHERKMAAEKLNKMLAYRKELQEQLSDNSKLRESEGLGDEVYVKLGKEKIERQDREFFEYADKVRGMIKSRGGRTLIPLEKVVENYKKMNNLPYKVERPCGGVPSKRWSKLAYDRDSDPNYMKTNWKQLYE